MITKTCLIFEGSPILSGITTRFEPMDRRRRPTRYSPPDPSGCSGRPGASSSQLRVARDRNDADGAKVLVSLQGVDTKFAGGRSCRRRCAGHADPVEVGIARGGIARCSPSLVVGNQQLLVGRVQHNRGRRIAHRDHALNGIRSPPVLEVDNRDGVGVVEGDVGYVVLGIDGDRVRARAVSGVVHLPGTPIGSPRLIVPTSVLLPVSITEMVSS